MSQLRCNGKVPTIVLERWLVILLRVKRSWIGFNIRFPDLRIS